MKAIVLSAERNELMAILANAHIVYHSHEQTKMLRKKCLANLHRLPSKTGEPAVDSYGIPYGRREPITKPESKHLKMLSWYAKQVNSAAWCSGIIKLGTEEPAVLYYTKGKESSTKGFARNLPFNASKDEFETFHSSCDPSSHEQGKQLVYDEADCPAREIRPNRFGLNFDPLEFTNKVVDTIGVACSMPIDLSLYKLDSYTTGGFFRCHRDTSKAANHVGTLVIALPTDFEGGEFILRHKGHEVKLDWSNKKQKENPGALSWVFFYSDIEHEVLPVTSGHRLTLSYDVYRKPGEMHYRHEVGPMPALDASTLPLFVCLRSAISDPLFLTEGGRLAIGLEHKYPLKSTEWTTNFKKYLKGTDATLTKVFEKMETPFEVVAVHETDVDEFSNRGCGDNLPVIKILDGWGSFQEFECFITGPTYQVSMDGRYLKAPESYENAIYEDPGLNLDETLVWIRKPEEYVESITFRASGYGHQNTTEYVACAFIVTIPPFNHALRKDIIAIPTSVNAINGS